MSLPDVAELKAEFKNELFENILPFWFRLKTDESFISALDSENRPIPEAPLGLIMVSRLLWTYSRAFALYGQSRHKEFADHAKRVLAERFEDREHGGYYWSLDSLAQPIDKKKQCYGQAFCIYAFSEHAIATRDADSLQRAKDVYLLLEQKAWDAESGGYLETFEANWTPLDSMRLSEVDLDAPKTMNNHLHMIEAYSNLLRAERSEAMQASCRRLLRVIIDRIILPETPRFGLFYDRDWKLIDPVVSPGHDIEGSWLLWEAAEILGDEALEHEIKPLALKMAELVLQTGVDDDGSVFDEFHLEHPRSETKCWWPQAEGVVGFFNAYELSGDQRFLEAAAKLWRYIRETFVDRRYGEWIWGVHADGQVMKKEKAGPWKASYHNGRACFEMIARIDKLLDR